MESKPTSLAPVQRLVGWIFNFFLKRKGINPPVEKQNAARVQVLITKKMRNELSNLGWLKRDVDQMSPQTAASIISSQKSPSNSNPPNPQDHPGRSPRVHPVVGPLSDTEK